MKCTGADSVAFAFAGAGAACQRWRLSSWNRINQIQILYFGITFQEQIGLVHFHFRRVWDYLFLKAWKNKQYSNSTHPKSILNPFCVTPPSKCRMPAKSTFLVIDMKSLCKHIPMVGDRHWFVIQKCIIMGEKKDSVYFSWILELILQA